MFKVKSGQDLEQLRIAFFPLGVVLTKADFSQLLLLSKSRNLRSAVTRYSQLLKKPRLSDKLIQRSAYIFQLQKKADVSAITREVQKAKKQYQTAQTKHN